MNVIRLSYIWQFTWRNFQCVYFTDANAAQRVERSLTTTLTNFFLTCESDPFARILIYSEMPRYYTWNTALKKFQRRKKGDDVACFAHVYSTDALGQMYTVHPCQDKCFYFRLLLQVRLLRLLRPYILRFPAYCGWCAVRYFSGGLPTFKFARNRYTLGLNARRCNCFCVSKSNSYIVCNNYSHMTSVEPNRIMGQIQGQNG